VGIIIVSTVLVVADLQRANTTLAVQIGDQPAIPVDLNQSFAISPSLLGSNVFPKTGTSARDQQGRGFMSYDQPITSGLKSVKVKFLRFPGGNWGEEHTLSIEQLDAFSDLLNQVGAEGMVQAQLSDPIDITPVSLATRANRAALWVDYMNNEQSIQRLDNAKAPFHPIKYWTIGNEPDLLINPDTGKKYTAAEYTQAFIIYSLAMHDKDPSIKIFGPEISQYPSPDGPKDANGKLWMDTFLSGISDYERTHGLPFHLLDGVSFHDYPFGNKSTTTATLLQDPDRWDTSLLALRQLIRQKFARDIPLAITEINTNSDNSVPSPRLAATWWANTLGKLISNQVEYVAFFSTEGVDLPHPLFTQKGLKETTMLRSTQLFVQLQDNMVPVQGRQGAVGFYATQDNQHRLISLLFVNNSADRQQVNIRANSLLPFSAWHNSAFTINSYEMVVLTLHRDGNNEAFRFENTESAQQILPDIQHIACESSKNSTFTC